MLFKYAIAVWAIAIVLMWLLILVRVYVIEQAVFKEDINLGLVFFALLVLFVSFLISTPSFLLYVLAAKYICKMPYDTITKKVLLSLALLCIMGCFMYFFKDFVFVLSESLTDTFPHFVLAASVLAVFLVQLPPEKFPNEGAI